MGNADSLKKFRRRDLLLHEAGWRVTSLRRGLGATGGIVGAIDTSLALDMLSEAARHSSNVAGDAALRRGGAAKNHVEGGTLAGGRVFKPLGSTAIWRTYAWPASSRTAGPPLRPALSTGISIPFLSPFWAL